MNKVKNNFFEEINNSKPLFVLEMANNHMGDVNHGLKIIREFAKVTKKYNFKFAFKFQFRDIDSFIHPDYKKRTDIKYVKRFLETNLPEESFIKLKNELKKYNYISICTPFDEKSVEKIEKLNFDIIKIGSCSFTDWPLLEIIVKTNKSIIISTAGAELKDIDNVVSFLQHRNKNFALMHCVGEYPTKENSLLLNQIDLFKDRYKNIPIGFSTHEEPDNFIPVQIAISKGAEIFERHVAIKSDKYEINAYSSTPEQIDEWLKAADKAIKINGVFNRRAPHSEKEMADLRQFKRGIFAKIDIKKGELITKDNVFYAFPNTDKQLLANDMSKYNLFYATKDIKKNEPVINIKLTKEREKIYSIVTAVGKIIKESNVIIPDKVDLEISHHYGIEKFDKYGLTMITVVNRDYCKKLLIMLPGQFHPIQYHKKKEETFHFLFGEFNVILNKKNLKYKPGNVLTVKPGVKHSFSTKTGGILEEISSTHFINDSFYEDKKITNNKNRKTIITYWRDTSLF